MFNEAHARDSKDSEEDESLLLVEEPRPSDQACDYACSHSGEKSGCHQLSLIADN